MLSLSTGQMATLLVNLEKEESEGIALQTVLITRILPNDSIICFKSVVQNGLLATYLKIREKVFNVYLSFAIRKPGPSRILVCTGASNLCCRSYITRLNTSYDTYYERKERRIYLYEGTSRDLFCELSVVL